MWLINTSTLHLEFFEGLNIPRYAILSHTWENEELTFQQMNNLDLTTRSKLGYVKIENFCNLVQSSYDIKYGWVDTCCIDKQSSAELSEAINSMYEWYRNAEICIIYLSDVPNTSKYLQVDDLEAHLTKSRWFKRGFTLQELVAPRRRAFYVQNWEPLCLAERDEQLTILVANLTSVSIEVLTDRDKLREVCVATRMSWAAHRNTTRPEDMAYCLMGIFNVNMAVLYGEGLGHAFRRLQEEIMKSSFDQTIFAWRQKRRTSGLLASSPTDFAQTPELGLWNPSFLAPTTSTNIGILFRPGFIELQDKDKQKVIGVTLQCDVYIDGYWRVIFLQLEKVEGVQCYVNNIARDVFRRVNCHQFETRHLNHPRPHHLQTKMTDVLVVGNDNFELLQVSKQHHVSRWGDTSVKVSRTSSDDDILPSLTSVSRAMGCGELDRFTCHALD